jgi:uncharacterized protein (DUF2252 family)
MDEDRLKHSLAVAKKMIELNDKNLDEIVRIIVDTCLVGKGKIKRITIYKKD